MKRIIVIYGTVAGLVVATLMLFTVNTFSHCEGTVDYGTSMLVGYASMLLAFSLVFVGIRNYRDRHNNGVISFGKAFRLGLLMVLLASTIYVLAWLVDYYFFIPDFMEQYSAHMLEALKRDGASPQEIAKQREEMAHFARMYQNPLFNALMTYAEILPVGLVVTLLSAWILKRKTAKIKAATVPA